jgi:hypothetical protein
MDDRPGIKNHESVPCCGRERSGGYGMLAAQCHVEVRARGGVAR